MMRLRTKWVHGWKPVVVEGAGWHRRYRCEGEEHTSFASLMEAVAGSRTAETSFARYFQLGRYGVEGVEPVLTPVEMLKCGPPAIVVKELGVDLQKYERDVRRLFYARFGKRLKDGGYTRDEIEDCLQNVYLGIRIRNDGKGAWDPDRCSLGYYVNMVAFSVVTNHYNKRRRRLSRERVGVLGYNDEGELSLVDVASSSAASVKPRGQLNSSLPVEDLQEWIRCGPEWGRKRAERAVRILPYVAQGMKRGEIASAMGMKKASVGRALAYIREAAVEWAEGR